MLSAAVVQQHVTTIDVSSWPQWLQVLCGTLLVAFFIWVGMKLLKVALWVVFFIVLIGGLAWAGWLLLQAFGVV